MAILLSSEKFIKDVTSISDNLAGKYILPSLREAQDIGLRGILGDALLDRLKELVRTGAIDNTANAAYKTLVDKCQFYLAYATVVEVTTKVQFKVGNAGVQKTTDENMQAASNDEVARLQYYYQSKADACCLDLQNYLLDNRASYPELTDRAYNRIQSNLHSAASCGIFLGGARGKGNYSRRKECRR